MGALPTSRQRLNLPCCHGDGQASMAGGNTVSLERCIFWTSVYDGGERDAGLGMVVQGSEVYTQGKGGTT